ncbi:MAG: hypothetical protein U0Q55_04880 [Vicinamibacterales bacterium]
MAGSSRPSVPREVRELDTTSLAEGEDKQQGDGRNQPEPEVVVNDRCVQMTPPFTLNVLAGRVTINAIASGRYYSGEATVPGDKTTVLRLQESMGLDKASVSPELLDLFAGCRVP